MAIMLERENVAFDVYEMRAPDAAHAIGGSVVLSPNALRLIEDLGFLERLVGMPWQELITFDEQLNVESKYFLGSERLYGYDALRIVRQTLIEAMKNILQERGVYQRIHWNSKLKRILTDDSNGVEFELENSDRHRTDVLIGSDGIHSRVRRHVAPDVKSEYAGYFMCLSYIATSALRLPPEKEQYRYKPMLIQCKSGGMQISAQREDGSECFCLRQFHYSEQDAAGWKALGNNKSKLLDMFKSNYGEFPDVVKSAIDASTEEGMALWPIYTIPRLERWASQSCRVVLIGDAAHAIPPAVRGQDTSTSSKSKLMIPRRQDKESIKPSKTHSVSAYSFRALTKMSKSPMLWTSGKHGGKIE